MASRAAERLSRAYEARLGRIRSEVERRVVAAYEVDADDIAASVDAFIARVEPIVAAGQTSAASLAGAFLRTYARAQVDETLELDAESPVRPGLTAGGKPLAEGMAAFGPMILGQVAQGRSVGEAIEYGQYLATRFGDSEVVAAVDREFEHQAKAATRVVGWEGIVEPDACDRCTATNEGRHGLDDEFYRHGSDRCTRLPVFG